MLTVGLVGGIKNSEMPTDAYGGVGGLVKKLGNAYGCLQGEGVVGEIGCLRNM